MEATRIADELYALPPGAFTAARDEQVARARAAGDKVLASALAALKRPTVGAWLVNVVALRDPAPLQELLALAEELRAASGAAQLRELSQRRRRAIDAVVAAARSLAAAANAPTPTGQQLSEVESTLTAAMADEDASSLVRTGRVLKALSYGGFGGFGDLGGAVVTRPSSSSSPSVSSSSDVVSLDEARAARRAGAQEKLRAAQAALDEAAGAEATAVAEVQRLGDEIDALQQRYTEAERAARAARQARVAAERDLSVAKRRISSASTVD